MTDLRLAPIEACVFDAYGTLFDVHSAAARWRDRLGDKANALSSVWRSKQVEYSWLRSLMGCHADFLRVTADSLDYALAEVGIADDALREQLMETYRALAPYPDARPTLAALRSRGFKTAILSNGSPEMLASAVERAALGPLLDQVLSVEEIGIYKPHPSVYRLAVERLGTPAERICFVSSNGWDAAGAAHFGFRVAWVNRFGQAAERLPGIPEATLSGLAELPGLLDGPGGPA